MKPFWDIVYTDFKNMVLRKTRSKFFKVQSSKPRRLYKYACNSENIGRIDLKFCVYTFELMYITKIKLKKIDFVKILTRYNPLMRRTQLPQMVNLPQN